MPSTMQVVLGIPEQLYKVSLCASSGWMSERVTECKRVSGESTSVSVCESERVCECKRVSECEE